MMNDMKKFTIELNENQLAMIDKATELYSRIICGQMWLSPFQEILGESYEKTHPGKKWVDIHEELEEDMKMLQRKYFNLAPNASYGLGYSAYADALWDIHKCCEHARYLAMPEERKHLLRHSVMADKPIAFGKEELIKISKKKRII